MTHPDDKVIGSELDRNNPYAASQLSRPGANRLPTRSDERLNPWFSIWTRPRATIRQVIDENPKQHVLLLAGLAGISRTLDRASMRDAGDVVPLAGILGLTIFLGPLVGIVAIYLGGAVLWLTGKWLGGVAQAMHVRAALAWGQLPSIWALVLWVPLLGIFGSEMFTSTTPRLDANPSLFAILLGFGGISLVVLIWQIVVVLKCVGEVQQFSAWRALGAALVATALMFAIVLIPLVIIVSLTVLSR